MFFFIVTWRNLIPGILLLFVSTAVCGDVLDSRHGTVEDGKQRLSFEGGLTTTWQHADSAGIGDEMLGSLDLVATMPKGGGLWTLYVEGSTTPLPAGVSSIHPAPNSDAGTALDTQNRGRLQVSELHYAHPLDAGRITVGLLNPTGFLDTSKVANNETSQFLSATLVNNPTIEFPDYTLGAAYHYDADRWSPGVTLLLSDAHGLAGNSGSYSDLFTLGRSNRDLFLATELYWQPPSLTLRLGSWYSSTRHDYRGRTNNNCGIYSVIDGYQGWLHWNLRGGVANRKVAKTATFIAIATETVLHDTIVGVGFAHNGAGENGNGINQAEGYTRMELSNSVHLTTALQWIDRVEKTDKSLTNNTLIASLRAEIQF